ncbi:MAG: putative GTPase, probable translation factor [Planctomycetota bacterium]|nr:putative GTPase, probable translation factor [Planctomycetota bacterium]
MRAGLVGFAGSGKSTLFHLLTGATPDPGKVHSGQVGIATLADPRLDFLAAMHKPKKITSATVEILDTPGLMPGSHGDNPQRLALIREGDALLIVLGAFSGNDPAADLTAFREELFYADLSVVTNRVERLEANVKKPRPDREILAKELELVKRVLTALEAGQTIASLGLNDEDKKPMRSFGLLTDKPQVVIVNSPQGEPVPEKVQALAPGALAIDAKLELELAQLDPAERAVFMEEMGITDLGRDRIIREAYHGVGIITFFTAGEPEVRGWNVERGGTAVDAAGKIHTDLARGFIRAEVTAYDDLATAGSVKEAKARNMQRLEGKDYIVKDGDIMFFRSSV